MFLEGEYIQGNCSINSYRWSLWQLYFSSSPPFKFLVRLSNQVGSPFLNDNFCQYFRSKKIKFFRMLSDEACQECPWRFFRPWRQICIKGQTSIQWILSSECYSVRWRFLSRRVGSQRETSSVLTVVFTSGNFSFLILTMNIVSTSGIAQPDDLFCCRSYFTT